jgi:hypothetical protein
VALGTSGQAKDGAVPDVQAGLAGEGLLKPAFWTWALCRTHHAVRPGVFIVARRAPSGRWFSAFGAVGLDGCGV